MYTSRRIDLETDLYYYRARYYDTDTGRFLSNDPYPGSLKDPAELVNKYNYVRNNPVNFVDPWGLVVEVIYEHPIMGNPNVFGHSSIRVNNSVYEVQKFRDEKNRPYYKINKRTYDSLINDSRGEDSVSVPLSYDKELDLQMKLESQVNNRYNYDYQYNNCADFVEDSLRRVGVDLPMNIIETPENTLNQTEEYVKKKNKQR